MLNLRSNDFMNSIKFFNQTNTNVPIRHATFGKQNTQTLWVQKEQREVELTCLNQNKTRCD